MNAELIINWMIQTGIDISILVVLILVFRRPFGRIFGAAAAYSLWLLPFLRLFFPQTPITLPRPSWMKVPVEPTSTVFEFSASIPATPAPVADPIHWQAPLFFIWLSIAILWFCTQFLRQKKFVSGILNESDPAPAKVQAQLLKASQMLGKMQTPNVRLSKSNVGPMVTGLFKPIVVLPQNFETDFTQEQQFLALTHELSHIKRFDLWAAFGTLLFRALNWPNPLVHFGAAKFRADQEAACDAYVLNMIGGGSSAKQNYAETLIHSARLSRFASDPADAMTTNPLCLTIHHPLKERLMTMKSSKPHSTILSRFGVAAFLAAGLAITAPITIASAQEAPKVETKMKKVIKMVDNENGVETTKTLEIVEENGVTTVYSIDEHGNKTVVEESVLGDLDIMVFDDGQHGEKHVKIYGDEIMHSGDGQHAKIIVKRMKKGEGGQFLDVDSNVMVFSDQMGQGVHASAMVEAARNLLDKAENMNGNSELSSKAKRKLEKARRALEEAQEALEAE